MARPLERAIADDTSDDVIEEEPKPRALRHPAAEHAKASAHRLPVEEATAAAATALGRSEKEEAPRLAARREGEEDEGIMVLSGKNEEKSHKFFFASFGCFRAPHPRAEEPSFLCFFLRWRLEEALGASR